MKYIHFSERGWELNGYLDYIREHQNRFPPGAREFALSPWHYALKHPQCPHDSWLENLLVREIFLEDQVAARTIQIVARFLGAYHDGHFDLTYEAVTSYSFEYAVPTKGTNRGHGDWLIDELTLDEQGELRHEIQFAHSSVWSISCADLHYRWFPARS